MRRNDFKPLMLIYFAWCTKCPQLHVRSTDYRYPSAVTPLWKGYDRVRSWLKHGTVSCGGSIWSGVRCTVQFYHCRSAPYEHHSSANLCPLQSCSNKKSRSAVDTNLGEQYRQCIPVNSCYDRVGYQPWLIGIFQICMSRCSWV